MAQDRMLAAGLLSLALLGACQQSAKETAEAKKPGWKHLSNAAPSVFWYRPARNG